MNNLHDEQLPKSVKEIALSYFLSGLFVRKKQRFTIMNTLLQVRLKPGYLNIKG